MSDEKPAAIPPPPWQRVPERGKRKRRDPLTQEAIVEAAIKVLDAEGLAGFSMRRVADALNTGAASLYWHVGSKDGLFDLIFEEMIGEQVESSPMRTRSDGRSSSRRSPGRCGARSCATATSSSSLSAGSRWGQTLSACLNGVSAILRSGGVPDELAAQSYLLMISAVNGFTMDEAGYDAQAPEGAPPADEAAQMVKTYFSSLPDDQFSNLKEVAEHFAITDQDARFDLA